MKILHIAGWSGSGKTTFIRELLYHVSSYGKTGTIKHIHSHITPLPAGKDTTLHFESGANPSVGIDNGKTCLCYHDLDLDGSLDMLSDAGVRYAIIEGFKKRSFRKILIGEMDCTYLLKNPGVEEVISVLDQFDDWYTLSGLVRELTEKYPRFPLFSWSGYAHDYQKTREICTEIEGDMSTHESVCGIRLRVHPWAQNNCHPVYLSVVLRDSTVAIQILHDIMLRLSPCINEQSLDVMSKSH